MRNIFLLLALCAFVPKTADAQLKFTYVSPSTNTIKIKNFGATTVNISTYRLCALFEYSSLIQPNVALVSGDFNLSQNEEVTFTWNSSSGFNPTSSDLGLYLPTGAFTSAASMVDFMQYGGSGQGREGVAAIAGYWTAGTFLTGTGPWYYYGNGSASGLAQWSSNAPVAVTFQVNMSEQTVSGNGVHVAGDFQGWNSSSSLMTDADADGVYVFTANVEGNSEIQYKYLNGNDFGSSEIVPVACGVDDGFGGRNRQLVLTTQNVVADTVCFGACDQCVPVIEPVQVQVTFKVNMQNEVVSTDGVHVAGSFQGWNASASLMNDEDLDGIYEFTASVDANTTVDYVFINGNVFGSQELVPGDCGADNGFGGFNRQIEIAASDMTLPSVCFGACADCLPIVEPLTVNVTFRVDMSNEVVSPEGVHLAGNFQGWNTSSTEMTDSNLDGIYEVTLAIDTNSTIQYVFINGISFSEKEIIPQECGIDDGFGGLNREFEVSESDVVIPEVCFATCSPCLIVDPLFLSVTYSVNMQGLTIDPEGLHILGRFVGGANNMYPMEDINGDQVYEITLETDANDTILYVFVNGVTFLGEENVPSTCSMLGEINEVRRFIITGTEDLILEPVCFSSCENCIAPFNLITLKVNMMNEVVSPNGVHVAGNFQDWDPAASEMTDANGDGIYEFTFESDEWANLSFKFINGNTWDDVEVVPSLCGLPDGNGGYNRLLETGTVDFVFGPVCFSSCINCEGAVQMIDVTFLVNMANESVNANGVHIAGNFQQWDFTTSEMTDDDADGIYEFTTSIEANTVAEFKFINGNDWPFSEVVPIACGVDDGFGGINRSLAVGTNNIVYGPMCFGACVNCDVIIEPTTVDVTFYVNMQNETVDAGGVHIAGEFQNWDPAASEMTDDDLDGIYEITLPVAINTNPQFRFINGIDWPQSETVPFACGVDDGFGGLNRTLGIAEEETSYGPVCFSSCDNCLEIVPVLIVFRVDMSNENVSADGVFIAGSFNDWDATATQMSEYETGHYQAVVVLNAGETIDYKFINGSNWEIVPSECGVSDISGNLNRRFTAGAEGETLDLVCFASCTSCEIIEMVDITITVDMLQQSVLNGVYLAGSFNGFSANATPMVNSEAAFYTATVSVPANSTVTYKFLNGPSFTNVETVPFECGVDDGFGGFNRTFTSDDVDVNLPTVCFGFCTACPMSVTEKDAVSIAVYPNPANDRVNVRINAAADYYIVYDGNGQLIAKSRIVSGRNLELNTSAWSTGLYELVIPGVGSTTIVKQ